MKTVKTLKNKHRNHVWVDGLGRIWIHTDNVRGWAYLTIHPQQVLIHHTDPDDFFRPYRRIHKGKK